jgi:hypothetical protein
LFNVIVVVVESRFVYMMNSVRHKWTASAKGVLMKRATHAAIMVASLLGACSNQPKLTWEYPVGSDPVVFKICHMNNGETQEDCRNVEEPQQQSQGATVRYTVPLTRNEINAERIGVVACRGVCGPGAWVRVAVK